MKSILIVTDIYSPEVSSAAGLMKELAEGLKERNYKITVLASYPRHYLPKELEGEKFNLVSEEKGIKVIRVKTLPLKKVNFIIRGISQLLLPLLLFSKLKKTVKEKIDAVIVYSPPLPLALIGKMVKKRYGAKFILNMQDIFPQNAVDLGILKNKPLIKLFEIMEKKVYKDADLITFHSEGGMRFLIDKKNVPGEKIMTLYNWIDVAPYKNLNKNISFREKYNLENKFIMFFGGVIGPAQGLDFAVKVAKEVADLKDLVFLFVGDGSEKPKIEKMAEKLNLKNIITKPFVSKEEYPYLVKDVDVGLVCLDGNNKTSFIPSKMLGYMAASKPIVAFLNKESDGFAFINKANCGYAVEAGNLKEAVNTVRKIYGERNKLKILGDNGFNYASENLTIEKIIKELEKAF